MEELEYLYLTWADVQKAAEQVADKIREDGFNPDIIIAVSRGGFDPARIICDQLNVRGLASLQIIYYSGLKERLETPIVLFPLNAEIKNMRVLVVDDVSDTGQSLMVVKKYVEEKGASEVKIAALHHKPWSEYEPDYYSEVVDKWILYPWELNEAIQELAHKLIERGMPREQIPEKLREIGYTEQEIRRYLRI